MEKLPTLRKTKKLQPNAQADTICSKIYFARHTIKVTRMIKPSNKILVIELWENYYK